jgi:hypothetical protein
LNADESDSDSLVRVHSRPQTEGTFEVEDVEVEVDVTEREMDLSVKIGTELRNRATNSEWISEEPGGTEPYRSCIKQGKYSSRRQ